MSYSTTTVRFGTKRILVTHPNQHQYGHLGLEMAMSLAHARRDGLDVCFVRSSRLGSGLFELESPEVRVLRPAPVLHGVLRGCLSWRNVRHRLGVWREKVGREFARETSRYVDHGGIPDEIREGMRGVRRRLRSSLEELERERRGQELYLERRLVREPVVVRLQPAARDAAAAQASAHGIDPAAPLVCIHAREEGYKRGNEIHDTKPHLHRDDTVRNVRIESYMPAVDELVRRGYTVVRLGDATMMPVSHPGVVDLATSPSRTNLLEVYCLLRSRLLIASESGLVGVMYVTNTPSLLVNVTTPIASYPIRAPGLFLPKTVVDRRDGRRLTGHDLLTLDYHVNFRDSRRFEYVDNTPEQILNATGELLDWVGGRWSESPGQRHYHETAVAAAAQLRDRLEHIRKWGLHDGFLGDGRIARAGLAAQ